MTKLRATAPTAVLALALALAGLFTPAAVAAPPAPLSGTVAAAAPVPRTWHATVQCQIVRISDNNVTHYERANGTGNSKEAAINDAKRNINVPAGHYKRHCDAKRVW
jgi:hypothetical protein